MNLGFVCREKFSSWDLVLGFGLSTLVLVLWSLVLGSLVLMFFVLVCLLASAFCLCLLPSAFCSCPLLFTVGTISNQANETHTPQLPIAKRFVRLSSPD